MFAGLDLQCCGVVLNSMLKRNNAINISFETIRLRIKLLLSCDEALIGNFVFVLGRIKDNRKPFFDVFDGSLAVIFNFVHFFVE
jgi:hypothetical protein